MAATEVRTQVYLERSQHEALKRVATRRSVSMAQVVREAITLYLDKPVSQGPPADRRDPAWSLLEAAREIGGSGRTDGAARVEEDLYGPIAP
jgi:hypothetical protein